MVPQSTGGFRLVHIYQEWQNVTIEVILRVPDVAD